MIQSTIRISSTPALSILLYTISPLLNHSFPTPVPKSIPPIYSSLLTSTALFAHLKVPSLLLLPFALAALAFPLAAPFAAFVLAAAAADVVAAAPAGTAADFVALVPEAAFPLAEEAATVAAALEPTFSWTSVWVGEALEVMVKPRRAVGGSLV